MAWGGTQGSRQDGRISPRGSLRDKGHLNQLRGTTHSCRGYEGISEEIPQQV